MCLLYSRTHVAVYYDTYVLLAGRDKSWEFEQVFSTDSTQQSVYAEVSELVVSALGTTKQ